MKTLILLGLIIQGQTIETIANPEKLKSEYPSAVASFNELKKIDDGKELIEEAFDNLKTDPIAQQLLKNNLEQNIHSNELVVSDKYVYMPTCQVIKRRVGCMQGYTYIDGVGCSAYSWGCC